MGPYPNFYFRPARGEQIHTIISPGEERAASICGRVVDDTGRAVEDALVLLFLSGGDEGPELRARCVTDGDGHFLFGPLEPEQLYLVKVFKNETKLRQLEIRT